MDKPKLIKTSTVAVSLDLLLKGQLEYLNKYFEVIGVSSPDYSLTIINNREGIKTIPLSIKRKISLLSDLVSLWKLYKIFKKEKPQIIHSITPKAGLLSMTAGFFARVPIRMHTFTGLVFPTRTGFMQKLLINMDRLLCLFATHIYPEGYGVRNDLINYKITKKPLKILANGNINGIDTSHFDPKCYKEAVKRKLKDKLGIKESDSVFCFIGRLVGDKGINELITAFKNISQSNSKLLLVGDEEVTLDPLQEETRNEIQNNPNIITTGWVEDVRQYLAISAIFVFPSYREGMPNVVLQAGAMGLPQIVTNINGSNEIIIDNENGLIIPVKDAEALYVAMQELLINNSLRNKFATNARELIVNRFNQQVVWEALLAEYMSLL